MKKYCRICQKDVEVITEILPPTGIHYAKATCPNCGRFIDWLKKPDNEDKRTKTSKYTLEDFNIDYCEWCGRKKEELGLREVFHLHHKKWLEDGGKDERENIMIVCTACHALALWIRTYLHRHLDDFYTFYVEHGK